jgi:hypothetical protein
MPAPDAAPVPPPPGARGAACSAEHACAEGLLCGPLPAGYCLSPCGATGAACDGACVETGRAGELCMKSCTRDADCRTDEAYTCDPVWHACALPNFAAIVPKQCPASGPPRDTAFGASEQLSDATTPGIYQLEPSAVLGDDGNPIAMFISRGSMFEGNVLGVARPGGARATVKSAKQSEFDPWLARDAKGTVYAVWYGFDGRDQHGEIALATSRDRGATWSIPVDVHDPADCADPEGECLDKPMIAIGPAPHGARGEVAYVFYSAEGGGLRVRASRDAGATWSKPATALAGIYGNAAVGPDGRLHVIALDGGPLGAYGSAQQQVEYTVSSDGGATFGKPIVVSAREEMLPFFFANPSIAVDSRRGWLYVAYVRGGRDAVWDIVLAASRDGGKTWTRKALGDGCALHMVPNLALDPTTGFLHVAYYSSAPAAFVHQACTAGLASCTRAAPINDQPFGALSLERHGSKWVGEYESLFVDDKRRVLHAVWAQPIAEGDKVIARIFSASAKLK